MTRASWLFLLALSLLFAACGGSGSNPPPSSITLTVKDEQNQGYAAAYQVGNGAWTAFMPSNSHTYTFNLSGNTKYGVAVRCTTPLGIQVHILQSTNAEEGTPKVVCSENTPSTVNYTLNVNVSGVPGIAAGNFVFVNTAFTKTITNPSNPVAVTLSLPAGSQDLVVSVADSLYSFKVAVAKVIRNVNITNGGSSSVTLSSSDVQTPASVTYSTPSGFTPTSSMAMAFYLSADNKGAGLVGGVSNATSFSYRPVSGFASGDRYAVSAFVTNGSQILQRLKGSGGGNISLSLPDPWPANALSVNAQAHPTVTGLNYSSPDLRSYAIYLAGGILNFYATLSKGWLGSSTTYTFPNLSAQIGYTPFPNGANVFANITVILGQGKGQNVIVGDGFVNFVFLGQGQGQNITTSTNEATIQVQDDFTVGGAPLNLP